MRAKRAREKMRGRARAKQRERMVTQELIYINMHFERKFELEEIFHEALLCIPSDK